MGWFTIYDPETREKCGTVGDQAFDVMADALEEINNVYMLVTGRKATIEELEYILQFVYKED